jgi:UDP-4-amino-4,6-dideoxy-N-acetyl-beta-L-altrosamine N-acetyltransferase
MVLIWRSQPYVQSAMLTEIKNNLQDQLNWYTMIQNNETLSYWIIILNNKPIGVVNLANIDFINSKCTLGFYIGEFEYRSFAGLIPPYVYNHVFRTLKLNKVYGEVLSTNKSILEIHTKHGFRTVGVLKDHVTKEKMGQDVVVIELLAEEWLRNPRYESYTAIFEL